MKRRELWFFLFSLLGTFALAGLAQLIYPLVPAAYQAAIVLTMAQAGPLVALVLVSLFSKDWSSWKRMNWKHTGKGVLGMSLLSFSLPAAITASGALILSLAGIKYVSGGYTVLSAAVLLIASIIGCVFEEIGWRGFLLPAFLQKHSLFVSAVFSGLLWGAWHFPKLMTFGPAGYLLFIILITELSIIMSGIYARTNGNMICMVLFHLGINAASMFMLTGREGIPFYISAIAVAAVCCLIAVLSNRNAYFAEKKRAVATL